MATVPAPIRNPTPEAPTGPDELVQGHSLTRLDAQNPWPGLAVYDEASRAFFHGRDEDAAELFRLIRLAPLTVLYGKSGLGKSSLLQAGLFPKLREEHYFPVYLRVDFSDQAQYPPLEQVARRVEEEIRRAQAECPPREPGEDLWQFLHRKDLEIWSTHNFLLMPVLVFDQFEELFSRSGGNRERIGAVFDALADLIENRIPAELAGDATTREQRARLDLNAQPYRILLAFREDFLPDIETWKDKVPSLLRSRLRLLPMSRAQAIAATEQAGAAVLDEGVAAQVVDFVANREGGAPGADAEVEPVLLSLCCTQLNRRRAPGGKIDAALVASAGQDILQSFYDEALAGMPERVRRFIETYLIQGDRYRGSYPRDAAIAQGDLTAEELATLTDRHRLLRIDQQQGVARIELIHDRVVGIVAKARDERQAREREQEQQRLREEAERQAVIERYRREEAERSRARMARMRNALLGLALLLCGALLFAGWSAWTARQVALRATALRLAAEADGKISGAQLEGGDRGLLLALAADSLTDGQPDVRARVFGGWSQHREDKLIAMEDTVAALAFTGDGAGVVTSGPDHSLRIFDARSGQPTGISFVGHKAWVWAVAISADGNRLVSGSEDKTLRIWDLRTGQQLARASHPRGVSSVAISPDGSRIASASWDNIVRLWDARTAELVAQLEGHGAAVSAVAFAPDGHLLVSASGDGTLRLWDARTGNRIGRPIEAHEGGVSAVAFSPDGRRIISGGSDGRLRVWDAVTDAPLPGLDGHHTGAVMSVAISPDGSTIGSGGWDGNLKAWNAHTGQALGPAIPAHLGGVMRVAYSPNGKLVASGGVDKTLRLWDAAFRRALGIRPDGASPRAWNGVVSADGRLAAGAGQDGSIRVWDSRSGERLATLAVGHPGPTSALAISADGRRIAAAGKAGMVTVWEAGSGRLV